MAIQSDHEHTPKPGIKEVIVEFPMDRVVERVVEGTERSGIDNPSERIRSPRRYIRVLRIVIRHNFQRRLQGAPMWGVPSLLMIPATLSLWHLPCINIASCFEAPAGDEILPPYKGTPWYLVQCD